MLLYPAPISVRLSHIKFLWVLFTILILQGSDPSTKVSLGMFVKGGFYVGEVPSTGRCRCIEFELNGLLEFS